MEELTRILAACSPVLALVAGWAARAAAVRSQKGQGHGKQG